MCQLRVILTDLSAFALQLLLCGGIDSKCYIRYKAQLKDAGKDTHAIITAHMFYIHRKQLWVCTCRLKLFSLFSYEHITATLLLGFPPAFFSSSVSSLSSFACHSCLSRKETIPRSFHRLPTEQAWRSHPSSHQGSYYFISSTMSFVKARVHMDLGADSRCA